MPSVAPVRSVAPCSIARTCARRLRSAIAVSRRAAGIRRTNVAVPRPPVAPDLRVGDEPAGRWVGPHDAVGDRVEAVGARRRASRRTVRSTRRPGRQARRSRARAGAVPGGGAHGRRGDRRGRPSTPPDRRDAARSGALESAPARSCAAPAGGGGRRAVLTAARRARRAPRPRAARRRRRQRGDEVAAAQDRAQPATAGAPRTGRALAVGAGANPDATRASSVARAAAAGRGATARTSRTSAASSASASARAGEGGVERRRARPSTPGRGAQDGAWQASRRRWTARCTRVPGVRRRDPEHPGDLGVVEPGEELERDELAVARVEAREGGADGRAARRGRRRRRRPPVGRAGLGGERRDAPPPAAARRAPRGGRCRTATGAALPAARVVAALAR